MTMNTGDIERRIGLNRPLKDILLELGFTPAGQDKRATLWADEDYPAICEALGDWVREKKRAKPVPKPVAEGKKPAAPTPVQGDDDDDL